MIQHLSTEDILDRAPPYNTEMERNLIAAVTMDPGQLDAVACMVHGDDFHDADLGKLWEALAVMREAGVPINDVGILHAELKRTDVPDSVRGAAFIARLVEEGHAIARNAPYYARELRRCAMLRRIADIALRAYRQATDADADPIAINRMVDAEFSKLSLDGLGSCDLLGDVVADTIANIQSGRPAGGILTGIGEYDSRWGHWFPGDSIILAARTNLGKTAYACQVALHQAMKNRPSLIVSLEMKQRDVAIRYLASETGIDARRLRSGNIDLIDMSTLNEARDAMRNLPLRIWSPRNVTIQDIRSKARNLAKSEGGLAFMVIDYIGLIRHHNYRLQRWERISDVSNAIKVLAGELDIPILTLCQLNRDADGNRPRLSQLRDSGAIEQDADAVLLLHRQHQRATKTIVYVDKHRNGELGEFQLEFDGPRTCFRPDGFGW